MEQNVVAAGRAINSFGVSLEPYVFQASTIIRKFFLKFHESEFLHE